MNPDATALRTQCEVKRSDIAGTMPLCYRSGMNALFEAAKEVCDFMADHQWRYCLIGGLAVQRWGEARSTQDADLTLLTGFGDEDRYARALLTRFKGRLDNALAFSLANRVLLVHASNGQDVDISFGALGFEIDMIERATPFEFAPGVTLPTCSAEDLFVMKAFAARPQDWMDAKGIAIRQGTTLDQSYLFKHLTELAALKEAPELVIQAQAILRGTT